ncbi:hypothetical protein [Marinobacter subterrani]|nr:hypothetical protein [Marinobacter subterrani]
MSAPGLHQDPDRALPIPAAHQCVVFGVNHFDLLDSQAVYERIHNWLAGH